MSTFTPGINLALQNAASRLLRPFRSEATTPRKTMMSPGRSLPEIPVSTLSYGGPGLRLTYFNEVGVALETRTGARLSVPTTPKEIPVSATRAVWSGMWFSPGGDHEFDVVGVGHVTIELDDVIILERSVRLTTAPLTTTTVSVERGAHRLMVVYDVSGCARNLEASAKNAMRVGAALIRPGEIAHP